MSSFPPRNWEVRYLQDMDTFMAEPDNRKLSLATLLAVKPAGAREGNFRLVLAGSEDISVKIPVADFIPHKAVEGFTVMGQFQPDGQIIMQPNSTATGWVDFRELVFSIMPHHATISGTDVQPGRSHVRAQQQQNSFFIVLNFASWSNWPFIELY